MLQHGSEFLKCPHCGHIHHDSPVSYEFSGFHMVGIDSASVECESCENTIHITRQSADRFIVDNYVHDLDDFGYDWDEDDEEWR